MVGKILQSRIASLGTISVLAATSVLFYGSPARSQQIDGRLDKYDSSMVSNWSYGASDPAIQDMQVFLDELGYYEDNITGTYDSATRDAVQAYQEDYGLEADGMVDEETWNSFQDIDQEELFESQDMYDPETGVYNDYEDEY